MSLARSISLNMAVVFAGRFMMAGVGLAAVAILTRYLGPEGYGAYRTILTVAGMAGIAAHLGIETVVLRRLSGEGDHHAFLSSALGFRLVTSMLVMGSVAILAIYLPYERLVAVGIWVAVLYYVFFQASMMLAGVFQKHLRQDQQMIAETAGNLLMLGLVMFGAWTGRGVLFMVAAMVVGGALHFGLMVYFARRHERFGVAADLGRWVAMFREGLPIAGSQAALMLILRGDILILSLLAAPAAVGLYGVPSKIFEVVGSIGHVYAGIMMARFIASLADGTIATMFEAAVDGALIAAGGVILTLGFFAEPILVLIAGAEFAEATPALALVAIGIAANIVSRLLRNLMLTFHHQVLLLRIDLVLLVFAAGAYLLLIPRLSFVGAALATAMTECLLALAIAWFAASREGLRYPALRIVKVGAALLVAYAVSRMLAGVAWPVAMGCSVLAYLGAVIALGVVPLRFLMTLVRPAQ